MDPHAWLPHPNHTYRIGRILELQQRTSPTALLHSMSFPNCAPDFWMGSSHSQLCGTVPGAAIEPVAS